MQKIKNIDNINFNIIIGIITFAATCLLIYFGTVLNNGYEYSVGDVANMRFYAETETVNEFATQKAKDEAIASVATIYTHDTSVDDKIFSELDDFFDVIDTLKFEDMDLLSAVPVGITNNIYLTPEQAETVAELSSSEKSEVKQSITDILDKYLNTGIRNDTLDSALISIKEEVNGLSYENDIQNIIYSIISDIIEPNLIVDNESTEKAQQEKADAVEPVMVLKNQKIVDEGEIITDEIYSILESQGYIKKDSLVSGLHSLLGAFFIIGTALLILAVYIYRYYYNVWKSKSNMLFLVTLYFLCIVISFIIGDMTYFLIPLIMTAAITAMLFDTPLAIAVNFVFTVICCIVYDGDIQFIIYYLTMGTVAGFSISYFTERTKLIYISLINSIAATLLNIALLMVFDVYWKDKLIIQSIYTFASVTLSFVLLTGSLPIWEGIFGLVTNLKLVELINPNMPLMHRLMLEAPGTYHHSLVVSNLAEAAAYNINANPTLAKVGAYYHDIGKLYAPNYFTENIKGESPHNNLTPEESAKIIVAHTTHGAALAKKHKLPSVLADIIKEHHGTTLVKYFYFTAKKENPDVDKKLFQYAGPVPSTKESAIIMLADTAEAAVRSKSNEHLSPEETENFVRELIDDKLKSGQLSDCDITIKDIDLIISGFMDIFKGMYHQRISYPKETEE